MAASTGFPAEGGCDCGHIRYRMETAPIMCHACHCTWCQRETGSAFVLNATIELSRYTNLGADPILTDIPSATGQGQCIARCPKCYIAVWSVYGGGSDMPLRTVRVGTLDDPNVCPPQCHIYTSTKQKWLKLQDELPEHAEEYDREKYWDKESLERMAKVREEIERLEEEGKNVSL